MAFIDSWLVSRGETKTGGVALAHPEASLVLPEVQIVSSLSLLQERVSWKEELISELSCCWYFHNARKAEIV